MTVLNIFQASETTGSDARKWIPTVYLTLDLAVVPEVDQGISERFEGVVHLTKAFEAKQQAAELVFPREHSLNGAEPFGKNRYLLNSKVAIEFVEIT